MKYTLGLIFLCLAILGSEGRPGLTDKVFGKGKELLNTGVDGALACRTGRFFTHYNSFMTFCFKGKSGFQRDTCPKPFQTCDATYTVRECRYNGIFYGVVIGVPAFVILVAIIVAVVVMKR